MKIKVEVEVNVDGNCSMCPYIYEWLGEQSCYLFADRPQENEIKGEPCQPCLDARKEATNGNS